MQCLYRSICTGPNGPRFKAANTELAALYSWHFEQTSKAATKGDQFVPCDFHSPRDKRSVCNYIPYAVAAVSQRKHRRVVFVHRKWQRHISTLASNSSSSNLSV